MSDLAAVKAAIRPTTKLIHTEVIANPTTKIADVAALASIAKHANALLSIDSAFTPPPLFRPLEHGADFVVHSLTKDINGHGDAMGGVVVGKKDLIGLVKADALVDLGATVSPFNAWLIARGSVTLPLRLKQHFSNAQRIAEYLESDERVAYVAYPGLKSHDQHALATTQFAGKGYGGMLAFAVRGEPDTQNRFVANLKIITSALSLGHDESLIVHVGKSGRGGSDHFPENFKNFGHLRLSVGLEDGDDLIADVKGALDRTFA